MASIRNDIDKRYGADNTYLHVPITNLVGKVRRQLLPSAANVLDVSNVAELQEELDEKIQKSGMPEHLLI